MERAFRLTSKKKSELREVASSASSLDIFQKKHLLTLVAVSIVMGGLYAEYGVCIFINQKIGIDNIFLNGTLLGVVEVFGYVLIYFFANRVGRRQINIYSNLYKLVCSLTLVVMDSIHNEMYHGLKKAVWFQVTETSNLPDPGSARHLQIYIDALRSNLII